jgi:hypothetical protein
MAAPMCAPEVRVSHERAQQEEERIRAYIVSQAAISETAVSLANKLRVDVKAARRVLNTLAEVGWLTRRVYEPKTEPVYSRYPERTGEGPARLGPHG